MRDAIEHHRAGLDDRRALARAFDFQAGLGREKVAERITALATRLKDGMARMDHVKLITRRSPGVFAGVVGFEVDGYDASGVVSALARLGHAVRDAVRAARNFAARGRRLGAPRNALRSSLRCTDVREFL